MRPVPFVVIENKSIVPIICGTFCFDLPKQELTKWVALHEAVEEGADLIGTPDKFALNGREYVLIPFDALQGLSDCAARVVH